MRCRIPPVVAILAVRFAPAVPFSLNGGVRICSRSPSALLAATNRDEDDFTSLLPETSFGAEVVPEGQRPVNEYLDLVRAPLFGWASEETGSRGLFSRLLLLYSVVFGTMYVAHLITRHCLTF
jgi:hypothetical protein